MGRARRGDRRQRLGRSRRDGAALLCGGPSDGASPVAGLIADSSGNLYGTTYGGGASGCPNGCGVVFKLAGTGFAATTPFLAFGAVLNIDFGSAPNTDAFTLGTTFTLSSTAPAFNPLTQAVTLQIGTFAVTIPAGSFYQTGKGIFSFEGVVNGVTLKAVIKSTGTLRYNFQAGAQHASLTGTQNRCMSPWPSAAASATATAAQPRSRPRFFTPFRKRVLPSAIRASWIGSYLIHKVAPRELPHPALRATFWCD